MSADNISGSLPWDGVEGAHYKRHVAHRPAHMREGQDRRKSEGDIEPRHLAHGASSRHAKDGRDYSEPMRVKPARFVHAGDIGAYSVPKSRHATHSNPWGAGHLPHLHSDQAQLASMYGDLCHSKKHHFGNCDAETMVGKHVGESSLQADNMDHFTMNRYQRRSFDMHWRPHKIDEAHSQVSDGYKRPFEPVQPRSGLRPIAPERRDTPLPDTKTVPNSPRKAAFRREVETRRSLPSSFTGEEHHDDNETAHVQSLKEIGKAMNLKPVKTAPGTLPKFRNSPVPEDEDNSQPVPFALGPRLDNEVVCNTVFDLWMDLHRTAEDLDGRRKAAWLKQEYVPYHGTRHGHLTYGKDHVLIDEAFMMNHAVKGVTPDPFHIDKHLHLFDKAFQSIYGKCEGYVPWQMLQSCGFMFHHVMLVARMTAEAYGSIITDLSNLQHVVDEKELIIKERDKSAEELKIRHAAEVEEIKQDVRVHQHQIEDLQDTVNSYEAVRKSLNAEFNTADPIMKLEKLQKVYMALKQENEKLQDDKSKLEKAVAAAKDDMLGLHADLGRQEHVMKMIEDVLPAHNMKVKESMLDVLKWLNPEQEGVFVHALSLGSDPKELYCLMMGRNTKGQDLMPYQGMIGELRNTFHKVRAVAIKDNTHVDTTGKLCNMKDRPLTKSYLASLLKSNDVKELKARLDQDLVTRLSVAYNHGITPDDLVHLLDGRMSTRGICMITNRILFGVLREHDRFNLTGTLSQEIQAASEMGSLTAMIELRVQNKDLQSELEQTRELVHQLENQIKVRDFKFGKVIGIEGSTSHDGTHQSIADTWTLSSITKLDEFLARDTDGDFEALGTATSVPKFLRADGMIKNHNFGKKMTEDMINEIWASKEVYDKQNSRHIMSLQEYMVIYLQQHGSQAVGVGYNLLHACHKYKYDPDCELFLQVLDNRVSQDIYQEFNTMMDALLGFLQMLDIDLNPDGVCGSLSELEIKAMLQSFFADKKNSSLSDLCHALRNDVAKLYLDCDEVDYMQLFKEDENANQGEFATLLKRQHLQERMEFLHKMQSGLLEVSKKERITELGSRHVEKVLHTLGIKMTRPVIDRFLELGLGSSWKSGVSESVMGIMKGIRRGNAALMKQRYSNAEVCHVMNEVRESLGLKPKDERQYLSKLRIFVAKSYTLAGIKGTKVDKDGDNMDKLMLRGLRNVTYAMEKAASEMAASSDLAPVSEKPICKAESISRPISTVLGRLSSLVSQRDLMIDGDFASTASPRKDNNSEKQRQTLARQPTSKDLLSVLMQRNSAHGSLHR